MGEGAPRARSNPRGCRLTWIFVPTVRTPRRRAWGCAAVTWCFSDIEYYPNARTLHRAAARHGRIRVTRPRYWYRQMIPVTRSMGRCPVSQSHRREFLQEVGGGMLAVLVGPGLAAELGLAA